MAIDLKCTTGCAPGTAQQLPVAPPCVDLCGSSSGANQRDAENLVLCDIDAEGNLVGSAVAVYTYDENGAPVGAPTFVDPVTGQPYVPQGTLQPCQNGSAPTVQQFCFTSTSTGPVEHPGRQYEINLPINPGFAVNSVQIGDTNHAANIAWGVNDPDGVQFATDLRNFLIPRFPGATVNVNNPNAGNVVCGIADPMQIQIACLRLDQNPPSVVELLFNGGRDLIVNAGYNTTPPTGPVNGFIYIERQDAGGTLNCTNVANRGWETNDASVGGGIEAGADFELWGNPATGGTPLEQHTPTPRGTPVQEISADGSSNANPSTIWQTFVVPVAGQARVRVIHGARDAGEVHTIRFSTGDVDDNGTGDIFTDVTTPAVVRAPDLQPWTIYDQVHNLAAGTYTLAISTTNPFGGARGGLFTDMQVVLDAPNQRATALTDDDTCTVETTETATTTDCQFWQPLTSEGEIVGWKNVENGAVLTNAAFWGQVPAPECCTAASESGDGGSVSAGNLAHNYEVCGLVNGVFQTINRVVITDQSGGAIAQTFIGPDGGPVTPAPGWTVGACARPQRDGENTVEPGCANGVPWTRLRRETFNTETGAVANTQIFYIDSAGTSQTAAPAGFTLGACPGEAAPLLSSTAEPGCADGVSWTRITHNVFDPETSQFLPITSYVNSAGTAQPGAPANFVLGDCPVFDVEVAVEPGCAAGASWDRIARIAYDPVTGLPVTITYLWIDDNEATTTVKPTGWTLGSCIGARRAYTAGAELLSGSIRNLSGYLADPIAPALNMELVAWSVRHRDGTVTVDTNDGIGQGDSPVTLDPGEVIEFDAGDDPRGILPASVVIDTTNGSARLTFQYRRAPGVIP